MSAFFADLYAALSAVRVTDEAGADAEIERGLKEFVTLARQSDAAGGRIMFIGNGGSAAIASHMATDWLKNGGFTTLCFNDGAALTCIANDLGYEHSFALHVTRHATPDDILVAVSSSGASPNILAAVEAAKERNAFVITLSGFDPDNKLRAAGSLNFYIPSNDYGIVECAHLSIIHAALNRAMK